MRERELPLINAGRLVNLLIEQDSAELTRWVQDDFREFTDGTNPAYRAADKLAYIDNKRKEVYPDFREYLAERILEATEYDEDDHKISITFDRDFAEQCYDEGARDFYKCRNELVVFNNWVTIIKAVMDYQDEPKSQN